ncbi:MAG: hypothetical protein U1E51_00745 [Candidatus Binatia bacterium]|nr:hypothetical protein [Candidatus Binatia bacterium]
MTETSIRIARLLRRNQTMDFVSITKAAGERSRRSLFRDLDSLGYLTSFTHAGRYYTLSDIPQFDEHGLWFCKSIGFSRAGTLKTTLVELIGASEAGHTHHELKALLQVRVHNTLLGLVHDKRVSREHIAKLYVYVSGIMERAKEQMARRREWLDAGKKIAPVSELPVVTVIEVLIEVIRAGRVLIAPDEVVKRLHGRGIPVTVTEAEQVFFRYGLKTLKKSLR